MHWQGKAALMHLFSALPRGEDLHYFTQQRITRSLPSSDEKFVEIFNQAQQHLKTLGRHSITELKDARFYEFGAGWELGIPLSFYVLGVRSQVLVDIRRLLRTELVNEILRKLERIDREIPAPGVPERLLPQGAADGWISLLEKWYGIQYLAPCDARNTSIAEKSVDFVTSTNTMEHIPTEDIRLILKECRRLLKSGGLMSLIIDYQDHYSYSDKRITAYNFLKYSDTAWRWYNPALHYQNRLRHKDYLFLLQNEGFELIEEDVTHPSEHDLFCLQQMNISQPFRENYSIPELAIRSAHVLVRAAP